MCTPNVSAFCKMHKTAKLTLPTPTTHTHSLTHNQGMLLVTDGRGRLLYMNTQMRRTLGLSDDTVGFLLLQMPADLGMATIASGFSI